MPDRHAASPRATRGLGNGAFALAPHGHAARAAHSGDHPHQAKGVQRRHAAAVEEQHRGVEAGRVGPAEGELTAAERDPRRLQMRMQQAVGERLGQHIQQIAPGTYRASGDPGGGAKPLGRQEAGARGTICALLWPSQATTAPRCTPCCRRCCSAASVKADGIRRSNTEIPRC